MNEEEKQPFYAEQKRHMDTYHLEMDRYKQYVDQMNEDLSEGHEEYEHEQDEEMRSKFNKLYLTYGFLYREIHLTSNEQSQVSLHS